MGGGWEPHEGYSRRLQTGRLRSVAETKQQEDQSQRRGMNRPTRRRITHAGLTVETLHVDIRASESK